MLLFLIVWIFEDLLLTKSQLNLIPANTSINIRNILLIPHSFPPKVTGQSQLKVLLPSTQVPLFSQGFEEHSSMYSVVTLVSHLTATFIGVNSILTSSISVTRFWFTFINVSFTVFPSESCNTVTFVPIFNLFTGSTILTSLGRETPIWNKVYKL